jgi:hypothetical protein
MVFIMDKLLLIKNHTDNFLEELIQILLDAMISFLLTRALVNLHE